MTFIHSVNNVIHTNKSVNPFDSDVYLHGVLNVCDISFHLYLEVQTSQRLEIKCVSLVLSSVCSGSS